jgi:transcriptional regulator with XRE-family HTH domain
MSVDLSPVKQTATPPLRAVREAHGLGLRYVADEAGIDPAHLSRVERGQAALSVDALSRIAKVLGLRELGRLLAPYARQDEPSPAGEPGSDEATSVDALEEVGDGDARLQH